MSLSLVPEPAVNHLAPGAICEVTNTPDLSFVALLLLDQTNSAGGREGSNLIHLQLPEKTCLASIRSGWRR